MMHLHQTFTKFGFYCSSIIVVLSCVIGNLAQPCSFPVFSSGRVIMTHSSLWYFQTGDLNNDGRPDIISLINSGTEFSVLFNDGSGGFLAPVVTQSHINADHFRLADVNDDGVLDLVAVAREFGDAAKLITFIGGTDGSFTKVAEADTPYPPNNVLFHDVDKDGNLDLVVTAGYYNVGTIMVFKGDGNGLFTKINEYNPGSGVSQGLLIGDYDQDGVPDLLASDGSGIHFWKGNGAGAFQKTWSTNQGNGNLTEADFDDDGIPDIASVDETFRRLRILKGMGDGTFSLWGLHTTANGARSVTAADVDHDGIPDLITSNYFNHGVSVFLSRGDGSFHPRVDYHTSIRSGLVVVGDFNGDSHADIVNGGGSIVGTSGEIKLTLGRGDGTFRASLNLPLFEHSNPTDVAVGDLNRDGLADLVTSGSNFFGVSVLTRRGAFLFPERRDYLPNEYVNTLKIADLNNDGNLDVIATGGPNLYSLLGDGAGGLTPLAPMRMEPGGELFGQAIVTADFDRDGITDVVVGTRTGEGLLHYFKGYGDGRFDPAILYSPGFGHVMGIAVADFNNDSFPDFVAVYDTGLSASSRAQIWLNNGSGGFIPGVDNNLGFQQHPGSVASGDFNRDGRQDFAVTIDYNAGTEPYVFVFLGQNGGTFNRLGPIFISGIAPKGIVAADLNLDNVLDLATSVDISDEVFVLGGTGSGTFQIGQRLPAGNQSRRIAVGMLNQDSSPDLVVTNFNGDSISILPNECNRIDEPPPPPPTPSPTPTPTPTPTPEPTPTPVPSPTPGPTPTDPVLIVNSINDPGDGTCNVAECTLREAIDAANYWEWDNEIVFDPAVFSENRTIILAGTPLPVVSNGTLKISGPGPSLLSISGANLNRILIVYEGARLDLSSLTLRDGNGTGKGGGGGIGNLGHTDISNVVISHNIGEPFAGGIYNHSVMSISHSSIVDNNGNLNGGGIYNVGETAVLTIQNSTVARNSARRDGGGIYNSGELTIIGSVIDNNVASSVNDGGNGGGISTTGFGNRASKVTLTNTTVSDNTCRFGGCGLQNDGSQVTLTNVTVARNVMTSSFSHHYGGGILNYQGNYPGVVVMNNTIVSDNTTANNLAPDFGGVLTSQGYNLVEDTLGTEIVGITNGNILGQSALLAPLSDNGGSVRSCLLLDGSPAIDGVGGNFPSLDQRGFMRPVDGDNDGTVAADIGAIEMGASEAAEPTTVLGQVLSPDGRGLRGALVMIRDSMNVVRTVTTSSLGYYVFDGAGPGQIQVSVSSKRYRFAARTIFVNGDPTNIDFVGLE